MFPAFRAGTLIKASGLAVFVVERQDRMLFLLVMKGVRVRVGGSVLLHGAPLISLLCGFLRFHVRQNAWKLIGKN